MVHGIIQSLSPSLVILLKNSIKPQIQPLTIAFRQKESEHDDFCCPVMLCPSTFFFFIWDGLEPGTVLRPRMLKEETVGQPKGAGQHHLSRPTHHCRDVAMVKLSPLVRAEG